MQLQLLGPPQVYTDAWQPLSASNHAALLCYLAYRRTWVSREEVALLFYPDISSDAARTRFRQLLRRARKLPGGDALETGGEQLQLLLSTDVAALRGALGRGDWAQVVSLYKGVLLAGLTLKDAPGFEHWLDLERSALHSAWREAAIKHAEVLHAQDQSRQAAALLQRVAQDDMLAEDVVQALMRNYYAAGQREEALRVFAAFKLELARELDLEPLEETAQLAALISQADSLSGQLHRAPPQQLPLTLQRPPQLVGRDNALEHILHSTQPVVLVTGEPGVGKTRLVSDAAPDALYLRCLEGLEEVAYFPLVSHLRSQLTHPNTLPDLSHLGTYLDELARLVPDIAPGRILAPTDPGYSKARMLEAWARYLTTCAPETPFSLFLDDLQWADTSTLELLVYLAGETRLRVIATYRNTEIGGAP